MARKRRAEPPPNGQFYAAMFGEAELTAAAAGREGVDDELAMLRAEVHRLCHAAPKDFALICKAVDRIVRLVQVRYRLSPKRRDELADSVAHIIDSIGRDLLPPVA